MHRPRVTLFILLTLFAVLAGTVFVSVRMLAVLNGKAAKDSPPLFALGDTQKVDGTSTNVVYKRCLVTARHLHDNDIAYLGTDLRTITDATKRQRAALKASFASEYSMGGDPWTDISVWWLENKLSPKSGPQRIQLTDYVPAAIGQANGIGLSAIPYPTAQNGKNSPGYPQSVFLEGYGKTSQTTDDGLGMLHSGVGAARKFVLGNTYDPKRPGSVIQVVPTATKQLACPGDSGSPLRKNSDDTVRGVLSRGDGPGNGLFMDTEIPEKGCVLGTNIFATFDNTNTFSDYPDTTGPETNWQRVNRFIQKTCGKTLHVSVSGAGTVTGNFTPSWKDPKGSLLFNGSINTGAKVPDTEEFMHEGNSIPLKAAPAEGFVFRYWDDQAANGQGGCPCVNSTNPSCTVDYDGVGVYTVTLSQDDGYCVAVFGPVTSSSSSSSNNSSSSIGVSSSSGRTSTSSSMSTSSKASSSGTSVSSSSSTISTSSSFSSSSRRSSSSARGSSSSSRLSSSSHSSTSDSSSTSSFNSYSS